jgi:hypothetical protein
MKRLVLGLIATSAAAAPALAQEDRSVLSIITSGDPQTQLMSMVLTM